MYRHAHLFVIYSTPSIFLRSSLLFCVVLSERTAELASARNEMEEVSQMHKQLASEAKELDLNLSRLTLKKQELEEAAEGRKGSHAAQRSEIELAVNTYEQRLGLKFEREKDDALRFTFTNIDSADPAKKFTFTVFVNPSKIYEVLLCEPMIPEIDNMVANLNENPKMFGEFVRSMRQAFKDL